MVFPHVLLQASCIKCLISLGEHHNFLLLHLHVCRHYRPSCRAELACLYLQPHMECYYFYISTRQRVHVGTDHGNCPWGGSQAVRWWMSEKGCWCTTCISSLLANSSDHFNFHCSLKPTCHLWRLKGSAFHNLSNSVRVAGGCNCPVFIARVWRDPENDYVKCV